MSFQPLCYQPSSVFDGRNKLYGAYVMRKIYEKRVLASVLIAVCAFALAMGGPVLYYNFAMGDDKKPNLKVVEMKAIEPPPVDKKTPPPPVLPPPPPPPPQVASVKFLPPEPVEDEKVKEDEMPPQDDLKDKQISTKSQDGTKDEGVVVVDPVVEQPKVIDKPAEDPNQIYTVVQQKAEFPGGEAAMAKFLRKNFKYPRNAQRMGITGKVYLRFVVRKNGAIDEVTVLKGIANCNECNEEAMRLVRMMPPWTPAQQNGNSVNVYFSLPITFTLQD
jgi:protein TonB